MSKTYKKINGTWYPLKKIYKKVFGVWQESKKVYKKISGIWQVVHSGGVEYTFTSSVTASSSTGILLSSYVDPSSSDEFTITINSGVTLRGKTGGTGSTGANGRYAIVTNCRGRQWGYGYNGGSGGAGGYGINLTGFSGKTVTFINNGAMLGGTGGTGGTGGRGYTTTTDWCSNSFVTYGGCGGAGGTGGTSFYNSSGVILTVNNNPASNGATGAGGSNGANGYWTVVCNSCFVSGQKVLMENKTYKNIEDVKVGDKVIGAYGNINTVKYLDRPKLGGRKLYNVDGLITTDEHGILNGEKDGFLYLSMESGASEYGTIQKVIDKDGNIVDYLFEGLSNTKREPIKVGSKVASENGFRTIKSINNEKPKSDNLYHLIVDGDMTYCISNTFVSSMSNDKIFNYTKGEFI